MCDCNLIDIKKADPLSLEELNRKLALEGRFRRQLQPIFNGIIKDFRSVYAVSGKTINVSQYKSQFETVLLTHYKRVQNEFRGTVERRNGSKFFTRYEMKQEEDDNLEALILAALVAWRNDNASESAEFITQTNDIQMQKAIETAREDLIENDEPVTNTAIALGAAVVLKRLYDARIGRIIITETQAAAESTNAIEASALAGRVPFPAQQIPGVQPAVATRTVMKTWIDMDDNRVRRTHDIVGGTTIPEDEVFTVGGFQLRFPGDRSLGAALRELINCRCYVLYSLA